MADDNTTPVFSLPTISKLRANVSRVKKIQIFLDWDDTIIPTSAYFYKYELGEKSIRTPEDFKKSVSKSVSLRVFDETLCKFLCILKELGDLKILTCSERGWPELTCGLLFPKSVSIISSIPIIYASEFRISEKVWRYGWSEAMFKKYEAMVSCLGKDTELLISIGDSDNERTAALKIRNDNFVPRVLVIKMTERPSGNILLDSLIFIGYWITHLIRAVSGKRDIYEIILEKGTQETTSPRILNKTS